MWVKYDKHDLINLNLVSNIFIVEETKGLFEVKADLANEIFTIVLYSNEQKWKCEKFVNFLFYGLRQDMEAIDMTKAEYYINEPEI